MPSRNIDTINFLDAVSGDIGFAAIRVIDGNVALCLSLQSDGDIEVCLSRQDTETLIEALQRAADTA